MEEAEPELVAELVEERAELICAKNADLKIVYRSPTPPQIRSSARQTLV